MPQAEPFSLAQVERELHDLTAPLREQLVQIDAQLTEQEAEVKKLRAIKANVEAALRRIDPDAEPYRKNGKPRDPMSPQALTGAQREQKENAQKLQAVSSYIETHASELADGFSARDLARRMKEAKIEPVISPDKMLRLIEHLHANGQLRAVRKIRGGATLYALVGKGS